MKLGIEGEPQPYASAYFGKHGFRNSNILTVLQGLFEDFGRFYSIIIIFFAGFFSALFYRKVANGKLIYLPPLCSVYASIFLFPCFSLTQYNSPVMALAMFQLVIYIHVKNRCNIIFNLCKI